MSALFMPKGALTCVAGSLASLSGETGGAANLEIALELLAADPDKDPEARAKKMQAESEKALKKLGA